MVKIKNFDENIEKGLEKLGKKIEHERTVYETETPPERELVKRSIQSLSRDLPEPEKEEEETKIGESVLPDYLKGESGNEEVKKEVENLVGLVFSHGLEAALKEAGKRPPFVEDAFHDALIDKLLPELKKRGIVK